MEGKKTVPTDGNSSFTEPDGEPEGVAEKLDAELREFVAAGPVLGDFGCEVGGEEEGVPGVTGVVLLVIGVVGRGEAMTTTKGFFGVVLVEAEDGPYVL